MTSLADKLKASLEAPQGCGVDLCGDEIDGSTFCYACELEGGLHCGVCRAHDPKERR